MSIFFWMYLFLKIVFWVFSALIVYILEIGEGLISNPTRSVINYFFPPNPKCPECIPWLGSFLFFVFLPIVPLLLILIVRYVTVLTIGFWRQDIRDKCQFILTPFWKKFLLISFAVYVFILILILFIGPIVSEFV